MRGKKPKPSSPRATVTTVNHAEGRHPLAGSAERLAMLRQSALSLRIDGWAYNDIATELTSKFKLSETPSMSTVSRWVTEALQINGEHVKDEAKEYIAITLERTEQMMKRMMPIALGKVQVARTIQMDGQPVEVISEETIVDMARAAKVIQNNMQIMFRALGIGKPTDEDGEGKNLTEKHLTQLIYSVTQNVVVNGASMPDLERSKVLELTSGDAVIDALDAPKILP